MTSPSRPNIPVNVLVGLDVPKAGFGWSDEEAHDAFIYNLQVRYALGYRDILRCGRSSMPFTVARCLCEVSPG